MANLIDQLRSEARFTECCLREAALKLHLWAGLLESSFFTSVVPPEHVREMANALAKQSGRLSMAVDLAKPKVKK